MRPMGAPSSLSTVGAILTSLPGTENGDDQLTGVASKDQQRV